MASDMERLQLQRPLKLNCSKIFFVFLLKPRKGRKRMQLPDDIIGDGSCEELKRLSEVKREEDGM